MNDEGGFRRLGVSRADQARPTRLDVVLSVADIEETELLGLVAGGMEPVPLAPVLSVADAVKIAGIWLQPLQIRAVGGHGLAVSDIQGRGFRLRSDQIGRASGSERVQIG